MSITEAEELELLELEAEAAGFSAAVPKVDTPFDPANISFNELPEGDTGVSPVDITGQATVAPDVGVNEITAAFAPTSSRLKPDEDLGLEEGAPTEIPTGKGIPKSFTKDPVTGEVIEAAKLPTLGVTGQSIDQQSVNRGLALVSDIFSLPERALGAILNRDEDRSIIQELGDPEASITKELKQKLRDSGTPGVLKFLGEMGLSVVSDPLLIGSVAKAGVKGAVGAVKGARKAVVPPPVTNKISKEIQEQVELLAPKQSRIPKTLKEIDLTPGERTLLSGAEDDAILAAEAVARKKAPGAVEKIQKTREGIFPARVEQKIEATGIKDLATGSDVLTGRMAKSFDDAFAQFEKQTKKAFDDIEDAAGAAFIDEGVKAEAKISVQDLLPGKPFVEKTFRNATELTDAEIAALVRQEKFNPTSLFDETGRPFTGAEAKKANLRPKISDADLELAGISKPTLDKINNFVEIMDKPGITYTELKNARGAIKGVEAQLAGRMRPADKVTLINIRKHYTNLMGRHLEATDEAAFEAWKKLDPLFAKESKEGFKTLRSNFYKPDGKLKTGPEAFDSVISSKNAAQKLSALKERLPPVAYEQLQNAYFNRIIEGSVKNGLIDSKQFLRSVEKFGKDPQLWDNVLTQESKDVLSDLITDAVAFDKLAKFKTPKAVETAMRSLTKGLGGQAIKWAIWHKFGAIPAAAFSLAQRGLAKGVAKTEARQAVDFFKGVNSPSFMRSFKEGVRSSKIDAVPNRFKGLQDIGKQFSPTRRAAFDASVSEEELTR